jgi:DNA processing protein
VVGPGGRGALKGGHSELETLLALTFLPGLGERGIRRLLDRFGSAVEASRAGSRPFREVVGRRVRGEPRDLSSLRERARVILGRAREKGMTVLGLGLEGYPPEVGHLVDPPPVLFVQGHTSLLRRHAVAVVGTRRATGAGRRMARDLGRSLSGAGIPVVSGLALGIDGEAHRGALEGPGSTIAVLASGLDRAHPRSHHRLQERIREEGLLVSEFPPGEEARPHSFPKRNRILAALAEAVVVVEAGERSGAIITADHALDLGRDVWAVPGCVEYPQSRGTHQLLREGAGLLTHPEDLLADWAGAGRLPRRSRGHGFTREDGSSAGDGPAGIPDPGGITAALGPAPQPTDALARRLEIPPARLLEALSELELVGDVIREPEGWRRPRRDGWTGPHRTRG